MSRCQGDRKGFHADDLRSEAGQLGILRWGFAAIVFEDSPNGITAANRAGIFVVAVPNQVTEKLVIKGANLTLRSLSEMPLITLLDKVQ